MRTKILIIWLFSFFTMTPFGFVKAQGGKGSVLKAIGNQALRSSQGSRAIGGRIPPVLNGPLRQSGSQTRQGSPGPTLLLPPYSKPLALPTPVRDRGNQVPPQTTPIEPGRVISANQLPVHRIYGFSLASAKGELNRVYQRIREALVSKTRSRFI